MKVLFDYQAFALQRYGGVSRYYYEILARFRNDPAMDCKLGALVSGNYYLTLGGNAGKHTYSLTTRAPLADRLASFVSREHCRILLRRQAFDLFHPTYFRPYFLHDLGKKPFVMTIYDMIHELFAADLPSAERAVSDHKRLLAQQAKRIIALSDCTKRDIVRIFGLPEEKIDVVHLANSLPAPGKARKPAGLPERYILFVGNREGYKNFGLFARAVRELLLTDPTLAIVCAGGRPPGAEEQQELTNLGMDHRVHYFSGTDEILASLYANALLFVFPSLYEGFGIPVLEAFSCDCPVVLSNAGPLPEVAGDAAVYCDPKSESSMREQIRRVLNEKTLRMSLITKGRERLQKYSWDLTAEQTKQVYVKALGS